MKRYIPKKPSDYKPKPSGLRSAQIFKPLRAARDFVLRRRRLRAKESRQEELEKRAVSKDRVLGTLPERIVYRELLRRRVSFDFQSSLLGGRARLGGMVADFIIYLPMITIILRVQTKAFHTSHADRLKDDEQKAVIESLRDPVTGKNYIVYDLWDYIVYDEARLRNWLNRLLTPRAVGLYIGGPGRGVWMPSQEEWKTIKGQVAGLLAQNRTQQIEIDDLQARFAGLTVGDVFSGNLGLCTAGEFRAGNGGAPGVDFTGVRMYYDPVNHTGAIEGQNAGTKQFYLDTDGKAYAGAGDVRLDSGGLTFVEGTGNPNTIRWLTSAGVKKGYIYFDHNAAGYETDGILAAYSDVASDVSILKLMGENVTDGTETFLEIKSDGSLVVENIDSAVTLQLYSYSATSNAFLQGRRARGATASPSAVQANDILLGVASRGYGATAFSTDGRAKIHWVANQNWTDAAQGTRIEFYTTADGGTTTTKALEVDDAGNLVLSIAQKAIQFVDSNTEVWEDASSNLNFKDAVTGTKTLAQLVSGGNPESLDVVTAETSVTDTTTETTVYTFEVPANTLSTNNLLRLRIGFYYLNNSGANKRATVKVKYGATTMVTCQTDLLEDSASARYGYIDVALKGDGATNAQEAVMIGLGLRSSSGTIDVGDIVTHFAVSGGGTAAEDSTGALNLVVTVTHDAAHASTTFTTKSATLVLFEAL